MLMSYIYFFIKMVTVLMCVIKIIIAFSAHRTSDIYETGVDNLSTRFFCCCLFYVRSELGDC